MQLETLKIFCDVVRTASFSRGAAANGVSQSSASHAISELEKRLGVRLIDRSKRPLIPTYHGRIYFEGCRELVSRYFEVENRVKTLEDARNVAGTIGVASIYSVGLYHLSQHAESFQASYPEAEVRLEYLHPSQVLEAVREGHSELGIISFPRKWSDLVVIPWREEPMVLSLNPQHRLASRQSIDPAELDGLRCVGFDSDLAIRRAVNRFLRQHQAEVEVVLEFDSIENIKRAVQELPTGAAILPEPTLARELTAGTLAVVPFSNASFHRPLAIIHRRNTELSLVATHFLRLLCNDAALDPAKNGSSTKAATVNKPRPAVEHAAAGESQ